MKGELITYYSLTYEIETLNDTYALCTGLIISNPTEKNIQSCNFVLEKMKFTLSTIKEKCPHIYFYTKYIK